MDFRTLADAPLELAADGSDVVVSEHPIAKLGTYRDPRYGKFQITRSMYESWVRNLGEAQNGRVAIDYDHLAERAGGSTKAAGWITQLRLDGSKVVARIEWTPEGAEAVRKRYWLFVSPSFVENYRDEEGVNRGPALLGVALTNRPFLQKDMPALSLSRELEQDFAEPDQAEPVAADASRDSPTRLMELSKIAEALGLDADADEGKILEAIKTSRDEKPEQPEPVSLEKQAEAENKVVLAQTEYADLKLKADKGAEAHEKLHAQRFELAFGRALEEGRVDAQEETRSDWREFYDANADLAIKQLEKLPKRVRTEGLGAGNSGGEAPEGVDPESFELDNKVKARMKDTGEDYVTALNAIQQEDAN